MSRHSRTVLRLNRPTQTLQHKAQLTRQYPHGSRFQASCTQYQGQPQGLEALLPAAPPLTCRAKRETLPALPGQRHRLERVAEIIEKISGRAKRARFRFVSDDDFELNGNEIPESTANDHRKARMTIPMSLVYCSSMRDVTSGPSDCKNSPAAMAHRRSPSPATPLCARS